MKKMLLNATLTFAKTDKEDTTPSKFRIVANAGSVMQFWDERIAIDVDGVEPYKESIPIIYGHYLSDGIGHTTSIYVEDNKLVAEGIVSRDSKYANDFVHSSKLGFPWEASVGGYAVESTSIPEGETYNLHGVEIEGPVTIVNKFQLMEISVVEYGADPNTSSTIEAKKGMLMDNNDVKIDADNVNFKDDVQKQIEAMRQAQVDELNRINDIKSRSLGGDDALIAQAIQEGWTADKFELETLRASRQQAPAIHTPTHNVDDKALEVAFMRGAGIQASEKRYTDQQLTAADSIGNIDFVEFCERASNATPYSFRKDTYRKICASMGGSGLGSLLTNAANAILLQAYEYADSSWQKAFKITTVNDFKTAERWRVDSNFEFKQVPDGGELEHAEVSDEKYTIQARMWGRQFCLSEQAIVNGDALGVFGELLRQIAFGANEALNKECWSLFLNPANANDGKVFYSADHGSLLTGKALTLENLSTARAYFISRKKAKGEEPLGVPPQLLVVPTALEDKALMLTKATAIYDSATGPASDYNPNAGRFQVVSVPFLGYATYTNYSDTSWYLLSDPNRLAAFEIAFLNGRTAPIIRQDQMRIGTLGIEFDAHCAWGVAQEDYRGVMKITA